MILQEERELVVEYGRKLVDTGLVKGTFGNLSVFNPKENLMAISPSGLDYHRTKEEDVVVLSPDGEKVDGDRKPSSEQDMHRIFYQRRPEIRAVIHTHSTFATTLACLGWKIKPLHYIIAYSGAKDVPCIPYVPFGTYELAEAAYEGMGERYACLLGNHGLLACGPSLSYAFDVAQQMEFVSELYYRAGSAGEPVILSDETIEGVLDLFKNYRQK